MFRSFSGFALALGLVGCGARDALPLPGAEAPPLREGCQVATAHDPFWSRVFEGPHVYRINDLAVDTNGDILAVGLFSGTLDAGCGPMTTPDDTDAAFLIRLDRHGNTLWSRSFVQEWPSVWRLGIDASGIVHVAGGTTGTLDLGGVTVAGQGLFVARFDAGGNAVDARLFPSSCEITDSRIAVHGDGSAAIAAIAQGSLDFGSGPLGGPPCSSTPDYGLFLATFDPQGQPISGDVFGMQVQNYALAVASSADGSFLVTGTFHGVLDLGTGPLPASHDPAGFVANFRADGSIGWARGDTGGQNVAVDPQGVVYVTSGAPSDCTPADDTRPAFQALDAEGAPAWSLCLPAMPTADGLVVATSGALVAAGNVHAPLDLAGTPLPPDGPNLYVASLDPGGVLVEQEILGDGAQWIDALAADPDGAVVMAGANEGTIDIGFGPLVSQGERQLFLTRREP